MRHMAPIFTPAYPAAWLLFGMLFALAAAHFLAASWSKTATAVIYLVPLVWVALIARYRPEALRGLNQIDVLFAVFILVVLASLTVMQGGRADAWTLIRYMPFMMVLPYVCGRLMRAQDVDLLSRITLIAGTAMLPLLLIDRFTSAGRETGRWPFFGQDHGALLVGALLATALIALCVRVLACRNPGERNNRLYQLVRYGLTGLITVFLVWVTALGWLLAGLLGVTVVCWAARHRTYIARGRLLALVFGIAALSLAALPQLDPIFGRSYSIPHELPATKDAERDEALQPILGEASCQPIKEGVNSMAIRWVLYREAMVMFSENPVFGVGAARFGEQSCVGVGLKSFPHSTILQGFAELGVIGGSLLAGLLVLTAITLARPFLSVRRGSNWSAGAFALALFAAFLVADQIYGNYFMAVGSWLMLGIAASMRANVKRECVSND